MKNRSKAAYVWLVGFLLVASAVLGGCGTSAPSFNQTSTVEVDGVTCIIYKNNEAGGISCNWEAYNAKAGV